MVAAEHIVPAMPGALAAINVPVCWFAESLSSQRDIVLAARTGNPTVRFVVSHRADRPEILQTGDTALREPPLDENRLEFIRRTASELAVTLLHAGRHGHWHERHRKDIEACGLMLTTGATSPETFALVDDKVCFAETMRKADLPVVPSLRIESVEALHRALHKNPFEDKPLCIKPVTGMYGMGFWKLEPEATLLRVLNAPEARKISPQLYMQAMQECDALSLVLMPWLSGEEFSVDMLVEDGQTLCSVQRCKQGLYQHLECTGEATALAEACVRVLRADGLVNVQLKRDDASVLHLLEVNLRPSGGIGYTLCTGVNLPGMFVQRKLGMISPEEIRAEVRKTFRAVTVKPLTLAVAV